MQAVPPPGVVHKEGVHHECHKHQVNVVKANAAQINEPHDLLAALRQLRQRCVEGVDAQPLAVFEWEVTCRFDIKGYGAAAAAAATRVRQLGQCSIEGVDAQLLAVFEWEVTCSGSSSGSSHGKVKWTAPCPASVCAQSLAALNGTTACRLRGKHCSSRGSSSNSDRGGCQRYDSLESAVLRE
jgi:hypothetical protein